MMETTSKIKNKNYVSIFDMSNHQQKYWWSFVSVVSIFGVSNHQQKYWWSFVSVFKRKLNPTTLLNTPLANISLFLWIFSKKNSPPYPFLSFKPSQI